MVDSCVTVVAERRITHIISVCTDAIPAELPDSGYTHRRIPVEDVDYADLLIWLPSACQFIDQAIRSGGVVLVHCVQVNSTIRPSVYFGAHSRQPGSVPECGCCRCLP